MPYIIKTVQTDTLPGDVTLTSEAYYKRSLRLGDFNANIFVLKKEEAKQFSKRIIATLYALRNLSREKPYHIEKI